MNSIHFYLLLFESRLYIILLIEMLKTTSRTLQCLMLSVICFTIASKTQFFPQQSFGSSSPSFSFLSPALPAIDNFGALKSIDPVLVTDANNLMNNVRSLLPTYNSFFCNKWQLYNYIHSLQNKLVQIKLKLIQYDNVVVGANNTVYGSGNIVIGNADLVVGNNNWIFASSYTSTDQDNGELVIGNYQIQLSLVSKIIYQPSAAISLVKPELANQTYQWFNTCSKDGFHAFF